MLTDSIVSVEDYTSLWEIIASKGFREQTIHIFMVYGLAVLVRWPIRSRTAQARYSRYRISHVYDVWRDYYSRGQWSIIAETGLRCVLKLVSIPCCYFISRCYYWSTCYINVCSDYFCWRLPNLQLRICKPQCTCRPHHNLHPVIKAELGL